MVTTGLDITLRTADGGDMCAIHKLWVSNDTVNAYKISAETLGILKELINFYVATIDGKVIGFTAVWENFPTGHIKNQCDFELKCGGSEDTAKEMGKTACFEFMAVDEFYRRKGIARTLFNFARTDYLDCSIIARTSDQFLNDTPTLELLKSLNFEYMGRDHIKFNDDIDVIHYYIYNN